MAEFQIPVTLSETDIERLARRIVALQKSRDEPAERETFSPTGAPRLLTKSQVATLLGISKHSVDKLEEEGVIPRRRKIGRAVRWREDEIVGMIDRLPEGIGGAGAPDREKAQTTTP